jgi:hypothetical protein
MLNNKNVADHKRRLRLALKIIENVPDDHERDFLLEVVGDYESLLRRVVSALGDFEGPTGGDHFRVVRTPPT